MRRWMGSVALGLALAGPAAAAAEGQPPAELEGIRIGEGFSSLDRKLDLRSLVPFRMGEAEQYIVDTRVPLAARPQEYLDGHGIRRLELRLRDGRAEWIRVAYRYRDEVLFDDMAAELTALHGVPDRVQTGGPMQVGRVGGIRLYLWLRIWSWEWDGVRLTVEGKHYGDDKIREKPLRHRYTWTLDAGPEPEEPENLVPIRKLPTDAAG